MCNELELARELIARAPRIVVLTGAGISADSGVPTFRGQDGLWKTHRAEDLATPEAFVDDPRLVWEWYGWRRQLIAGCTPNPAHRALAHLALNHPNVLLVTQNVDGLHGQAAREASGTGDPGPALPVELHGNIFTLRCTSCSTVWEDWNAIDTSSLETLPHCSRCRGLARPHVVWFGEALDRSLLSRALCQAELAAVCLVVGTTAVVQPASSIAAVTAQAGGDVIEINPEETEISSLCSVSIRSGAAAALPSMLGQDVANHAAGA
ncbi:MAG: NAD-dependent deacylase [Pseudomonadota bacterium]